MRARGFSLIELLTVTGVIAVLAAVLVPIYIQSRKAGLRTKCQSNLRQIANAFDAYLADNTGCYPNTNNQYLWAGYYWREPIRKYVAAPASGGRNMVLSCPADPTPPGIYAGTSYAYSACFYMTPEEINAVENSNYLRVKFAETNPKLPCSTINSSMVRFASKKVLVAEYWTLHSEKVKVGWYDDPSETGNDPWSGERNYLFADGHIRFLPTRRIRPAVSPLVVRPRILPDINMTRDGVAGKDVD
ncbi:MAG: type II secretion system GspH family protein [Armatimonadetes bacterium]|nr:type II secretion system GspH family protein [Armatimonadota bacterium]